jgi:hypothetical protein
VNPDVKSVKRTLVFLKPDILMVFDRVTQGSVKATVQLRYQVYNGDGKGSSVLNKNGFLIKRPLASLNGTIVTLMPFEVKSGEHAVPKDIGVYPYVEVGLGESLDHHILGLFTAQKEGKEHGKVTTTSRGSVWTAKIEHNGQVKNVSINIDEDVPTVSIT